MTQPLHIHLLIVLVPLAITGVLHMVVVKMDGLSMLKIPISESAFGTNKTWRGIVLVTIMNAVMLYLIDVVFGIGVVRPWILGAVLGLAYMIFELPNSYFKRRMGIKPGAESEDYKRSFQMLDKMDSAIGVSLVYYLMNYVDIITALQIFSIGVLVHVLVSKILYEVRIKKGF